MTTVAWMGLGAGVFAVAWTWRLRRQVQRMDSQVLVWGPDADGWYVQSDYWLGRTQ